MKKHLLVVGIVFLFIGMVFQPAYANDMETSYDSSNNSDTFYYTTARLTWNEFNVDYEYSQFDGFGNSGEGPLGFLTYAYGLAINCSIFLLNGTIKVTPYNAPSFSLQSGDRMLMMISLYFGLSDDYNHDIN
jgi:hypothetical protein